MYKNKAFPCQQFPHDVDKTLTLGIAIRQHRSLNGHSKFIRFKRKQRGFSETSSKSSSNCMAANIKENKTFKRVYLIMAFEVHLHKESLTVLIPCVGRVSLLLVISFVTSRRVFRLERFNRWNSEPVTSYFKIVLWVSFPLRVNIIRSTAFLFQLIIRFSLHF